MSSSILRFMYLWILGVFRGKTSPIQGFRVRRCLSTANSGLRVLALIVPQLVLQVRSRRRLGGHAREPQRLAQLLLDRGGDLGMFLEILLSVLPSLPDPVVLVCVPGPTLGH